MMSVSKLRLVDNLHNRVQHIRFADPNMMIRELMANCIDAVRLSGIPLDDAVIKWTRDKAGKLVVFNNGIGLSAEQLIERLSCMRLSRSGRSGDVSMGAKVTVLHSYENGDGAIYTTCKDGRVSQAKLGWSADGVPSVLPSKYCEYGEHVWDVTDQYIERCSEDWFEVRLLGMDEKQKTADHPLRPKTEPDGGINWLTAYLNHRFYDLKTIATVCDESAGQKRNHQQVLGQRHNPVEKSTVVEISESVSIRYAWTLRAYADGRGDWQKGYGNHGCVVYKNEIYDGMWAHWVKAANHYGCPAVGGRLIIEVLIDDNEVCHPDEQRKILYSIGDHGEKAQVTLEGFKEEIRENIPDWLQERIRKELDKQDIGSDVTEALKELEQYYQAPVSACEGVYPCAEEKVTKPKPRTRFCPLCIRLSGECDCHAGQQLRK